VDLENMPVLHPLDLFDALGAKNKSRVADESSAAAADRSATRLSFALQAPGAKRPTPRGKPPAFPRKTR